ncbi:MAG: hypothetical protein K9M57_07835 [Phycisphaerae bacterium]|nr:hypothetical protein [Phycisphaerae bacterium]
MDDPITLLSLHGNDDFSKVNTDFHIKSNFRGNTCKQEAGVTVAKTDNIS